MNEARFVIRNDTNRKAAANVLSRLPFTPVYEVHIREYKKNRSAEQNRKMWVVLTELANHIPDEDGTIQGKEYWHHRLKLHFGYIAGTVPLELDGRTIDVPYPRSSRDFKVNEMLDYIDQLYMYAAERGVLIDG